MNITIYYFRNTGAYLQVSRGKEAQAGEGNDGIETFTICSSKICSKAAPNPRITQIQGIIPRLILGEMAKFTIFGLAKQYL